MKRLWIILGDYKNHKSLPENQEKINQSLPLEERDFSKIGRKNEKKASDFSKIYSRQNFRNSYLKNFDASKEYESHLLNSKEKILCTDEFLI